MLKGCVRNLELAKSVNIWKAVLKHQELAIKKKFTVPFSSFMGDLENSNGPAIKSTRKVTTILLLVIGPWKKSNN